MGRSYNKKDWYKELVANTRCWWCEEETPRNQRSAEHLLPYQYTKQNKGNCKMACLRCNNARGWLEELYDKYATGTFNLEFYIKKMKLYLSRIPQEVFVQFCSCQKNRLLIGYYEQAYKNKAKLHPFQPDILERLTAL